LQKVGLHINENSSSFKIIAVATHFKQSHLLCILLPDWTSNRADIRHEDEIKDVIDHLWWQPTEKVLAETEDKEQV